MSIGTVIRVCAGKQLLRASFLPGEFADKLISFPDQGTLLFTNSVSKHVVLAKKSSNSRAQSRSVKQIQRNTLKAFREDVDGFFMSSTSEASSSGSAVMDKNYRLEPEVEQSLEALILLQRSMLEKQWYLSLDLTRLKELDSLNSHQRTEVVRSGRASARQRRQHSRRNSSTQNFVNVELITQTAYKSNQEHAGVQAGSLRDTMTDSMKHMLSQDLLTHEEVLFLSKRIQSGLTLRKHKSRLKAKLGCEPSNAQWAASMNMSLTELKRKLTESSIAAQKLAMCNIRLVVSIARKYENMGVDLGDLIQEGLMGLRHGIEKFDSSKGFKLSTYVYWWIRQGIIKALAEYRRTVRIPSHVNERLGLIRKAKLSLEENGMPPSIENIAATLNMSEKKVKNATRATKRIFSFDKEYSGFENSASQTFHGRIADPNVENHPWSTVERNTLREDVDRLINLTLTEREQVIIRLYFGLDECISTWEDVSK
ncbi:hypothetical protein KI387_016311, partial [Taxus chinensis]